MEEINIDRIGFYGDKARLILPDGYEFEAEGNEVFVIKKKPRYPKTYEECHELVVQWKEYDCNPNSELILCDVPIHIFCKLIVARNIYWKIAGEQMGLGKPWEPDWNHINRKFYCIYNSKNNIVKNVIYTENKILSFPTEEMRDAFYENFKDLIEGCKELV